MESLNPAECGIILTSEDETQQNSEPREDTPLLGKRVPESTTPIIAGHPRNRQSMLPPIFIGIMLFILITGVAIGIYLLLEEEKDWPVNIPFDMISREGWRANAPKALIPLATKLPHYIILTHTATAMCKSYAVCQKIILEMQNKYQNPPYNMTDIPFNFLVSGDGETYEGRGWDVQSDLHPTLNNNSISIGIIGNFSFRLPYKKQLDEAKALIDESIRRSKLSSTYRILGFEFGGASTALNSIVSSWTHWCDNPQC